MEIPKLESLNRNTIREKYISIHYPEFHTYIVEHHPADLSWTEKLYWYYNGLTKTPVCPVCGNPVGFINIKEGYKTFCCTKCMYKSDDTKSKKIQTWLNKYGITHPSKLESVKEKKKRTLLNHYGVTHQSKSELVKEKKKQTTLEHYGVENPFQSEVVKYKIKQTCLEKYGVENLSYTQYFRDKIAEKHDIIRQKQYLTKKSNHSFNSSKIEEDFAGWLSSNNISFIRQYRSDKYPFACDFYFPEKDLYLEIQGSWTHGDHPFNPNNESDNIILEEMQSKHTEYYDNAIRVWTVTDPLKRETANKNGLNWVEVFSCKLNDVIDVYKSF